MGALRIRAVRGLARSFVRGDANDDGVVDLGDAVTVLAQLFHGEAINCGDASDADDSRRVDLSDAVYLLAHLIRGGAPPPYAFPDRSERRGDRHRSESRGGSHVFDHHEDRVSRLRPR